MKELSNPSWILKNGKVNEPLFCDYFKALRNILYFNSKFYDLNGEISEEALSTLIYKEISPFVKNKVSQAVKSIVEALRFSAFSEPLKPDLNKIHISNGYIIVDVNVGEAPKFIAKKEHCLNRLNVEYNPDVWKKCYYPEKFLSFLYDLLDAEDIITFQEFLGYCLLPSTKGQSMLSLIGSGGEGKSRITVVLQDIFGNNVLIGNYQRIETDKFFRYNLRDKLLLLDDDMQISALKSTGYIKNIITAETPIDLEKKGVQSSPNTIYARILTFGNGSPRALYDHSDGYARRLIILKTKPKPANRKDNPNLSEIFIEEKLQIFCWMLDGLRRLIKNDYKFTRSEASKANTEEIMRGSCNIIDFLEDRNAVVFRENASVSSRILYDKYYRWCIDNTLTEMSRESFVSWLKNNAAKYNIKYSTHIPYEGKDVRGFKGITTASGSGIIH